ncbi:PEPxxWA-CTERM sorting domain-containing protein [Sphingomonas trueperi]|uniref:PEPxxWA-CTERM sorting domain-containing protein n=1 Tax=Sphingomonas trueperi TaxID=53317 RepID=UPI003397ED3F
MKHWFTAAVATAISLLSVPVDAQVFTVDFSPNSGSMTDHGTWLSHGLEFLASDRLGKRVNIDIVDGAVHIPTNGGLFIHDPCCSGPYEFSPFILVRFDIDTSVPFLLNDAYSRDQTYYPDKFPGYQTLSLGNYSLLVDALIKPGEYDLAVGDAFVDNLTFVTIVPEPASWGMMLAGSGMAGAAIRRRRRKTVTAAA